MILGFLGIAAAHLAVVVLFDTKLEFLLAASIFIPFLVGFLRRSAPHHPILRVLIGAIILSAAAVIEMSLVTWSLYQIPLVPQNPYDWREIGNYGGSIAASFIVGALARGLIRFWYIGRGRTKPQRTGVVQQTLKYVGNFEPETLEKLEKIFRQLEYTVMNLTALVASLYFLFQHLEPALNWLKLAKAP